MKISVYTLFLVCFSLNSTAQDQAIIQVELTTDRATLEALSGLPTEKALQDNVRILERITSGRLPSNGMNNLSADELDTTALETIYNNLRFSNRTQLLANLNSDSKAKIQNILLEKHEFALQEELRSLDELCTHWNETDSSGIEVSVRTNQSLEIYSLRLKSSEPEVHDEYQQALREIEIALTMEEWNYFYSSFTEVREGLTDAILVNWQDLVIASSDGNMMIENRCQQRSIDSK